MIKVFVGSLFGLLSIQGAYAGFNVTFGNNCGMLNDDGSCYVGFPGEETSGGTGGAVAVSCILQTPTNTDQVDMEIQDTGNWTLNVIQAGYTLPDLSLGASSLIVSQEISADDQGVSIETVNSWTGQVYATYDHVFKWF